MGQRTASLVAFCVAIGLGSPSARAQPSADEIYEDAKDVIEGLIEREVAETVAPNIACYSRHGLLKYLPRTLQAIYERNYGSIKDLLRREVTLLAANLAYQSFAEGRNIEFGELLPTDGFDPQSEQGRECAEHIRSIGGPLAYHEELAREIRRVNDGSYFPLDACSSLAAPRPETELPCLLGQSVIASTSGRSVSAQELLARVIAITAADQLIKASKIQELDADKIAALRRITSNEVRSLLTTGTFTEDGPFLAFSSGSVTQSLDLAVSRVDLDGVDRTLERMLREPSTRLRREAVALWLVQHRDEPARALQLKAKVGDGVELDLIPLLQELEVEALPRAPGEGLGTAIARALVLRAGRVPEGLMRVTTSAGHVEIA
ncbi:MAG TPA: hypothetical protein VK509_20065, partial [Polyangiales bacterium]|nr:hypothetical protein [Polyangiales bacterium]